MAQEKTPTPERQLLNLIEGGSSGQSSLRTDAAMHRGLSLLSPQAWASRISFFRQETVKWLQGGSSRGIDIKAVNRLLSLCVVILSVYFMVNLFISANNFRKAPDFNLKIKQFKSPVSDIQEATVLRALTYYLDKIRARDIFIMGEKPQQQGAGKELSKPSPSRVAEVTQSLRLVGISWSNDPDVMLEDTKALKTYFLKKGQVIDSNNVKVEAIFKDKVILSFEGVEIELK